MFKANTVLLLVKMKIGTTVAIDAGNVNTDEDILAALPSDAAFVYRPCNIHGYYQEFAIVDGTLQETGKLLPLPMVTDIRASIMVINK